MAVDIIQELFDIEMGRYGIDIRQPIYDALSKLSSTNMQIIQAAILRSGGLANFDPLSIDEELNTIRNSLYGSEVKQAIYDALEKLSNRMTSIAIVTGNTPFTMPENLTPIGEGDISKFIAINDSTDFLRAFLSSGLVQGASVDPPTASELEYWTGPALEKSYTIWAKGQNTSTDTPLITFYRNDILWFDSYADLISATIPVEPYTIYAVLKDTQDIYVYVQTEGGSPWQKITSASVKTYNDDGRFNVKIHTNNGDVTLEAAKYDEATIRTFLSPLYAYVVYGKYLLLTMAGDSMVMATTNGNHVAAAMGLDGTQYVYSDETTIDPMVDVRVLGVDSTPYTRGGFSWTRGASQTAVLCPLVTETNDEYLYECYCQLAGRRLSGTGYFTVGDARFYTDGYFAVQDGVSNS